MLGCGWMAVKKRRRKNVAYARATILNEERIMSSGLTFRRFHLGRAGGSVLFSRFLICFLLPWVLLGQDSSAQNKRHPTQADEVYAQGMSALQQGDLGTAQAAFEKVVRIAPSSPEGHNSLGWVLLAQERIEPAIREFRAAVRLQPDFPQAHINLANAYMRKGDMQNALRESREAVRLVPQDSEAHRTLARALDFSQDAGSAMQEMRRAIEVEPGRAELHDDLGSLLARQRQAREAAAEVATALQLQANLGSA